MKAELLDILQCPVCSGSLGLHVTKENNAEIIEGNLTCKSCHENYLIEDSIPNLLPPSLRD